MSDENEHRLMSVAMEEAIKAKNRNEVPVGAVIVNSKTGEIIARNGNRTREFNDPSAHAEILVIREACNKAGAQRIPEYDIYVTLEPCTMCAGAISFARIRKIIFAAFDEKGGAVINGVRFFEQKTCHHKPEINYSIKEKEAAKLLRDFFKEKRKNKLAI